MNRVAFLLSVAVCVAPVFLGIASALQLSVVHVHLAPVVGEVLTSIAALAMLGAVGVCALNSRIVSLNRPARGGLPRAHVSPIPFIGSLHVAIGLVLGYGSQVLAAVGLAVLAMDPGGGLPALVTLLRNRHALFRGEGPA